MTQIEYNALVDYEIMNFIAQGCEFEEALQYAIEQVIGQLS